ncbi:hypothetical protein OLX02_07740 [Novosphingobium sp. KCTC 2891]|uniref:hypothetical protein n=1 Tax=Novosphingobium sp. KCTC 2891 TaxID=2989730 RepID=UPI0022236E97|nr:hypothetical protein [Novosphingobium sp. KCTC 2891]MCW1382713.1 hypothetical protein [Novosphingobium sp. KCTC 2891]
MAEASRTPEPRVRATGDTPHSPGARQSPWHTDRRHSEAAADAAADRDQFPGLPPINWAGWLGGLCVSLLLWAVVLFHLWTLW